MRRWRKVIQRVVLYGLIGLVVNMLVAWGFAAWGVAARSFYVSAASAKAPLRWSASHELLADWPTWKFGEVGWGVRWSCEVGAVPLEERAWTAESGPRKDDMRLTTVKVGWPWFALRWREIAEWNAVAGVVGPGGGWIDLGGVSNLGGRVGYDVPRRLPLGVVGWGLVLNTVMYGTFIGLCVWVPGSGRRVLRRRRGLCPVCGYDLCGEMGKGCSECGGASGC